MAEQSQVDEFQDDKGGQQPIISPEQAARNHRARENIYIGEDELKERQDESQRNNASQILSGTYAEGEWAPEQEERFQSLERGYVSGNLTAEQKEDRDYMKLMRPKYEPTKDNKLERIIKSERAKTMKPGKKYNTRANPATEREQRYSNRESLQAEKLKVAKQRNVKAPQNKKPILQAQPPGANIPYVIQGQPNDVRKPPTRSSNSLTFPTKEKVKINEDMYRPEKRKMTRQDIEDRRNEMRAKLSGTAALYDQLIDKFGGIEAYMDSIESLITGGVLPERILTDSLERLYPKASGEALDGASGEASGGVLDEEKFREELGDDIPPEKYDEIVELARAVISGGETSFPDKGGGPLSRGVDGEGKYDDTMSVDSLGGKYDDTMSVDSLEVASPPDGGGKPPSGGMPPSGGKPKNGGGSFAALQKMNSIAPQIASLLLNNRPLLIKKEDIPQIYPPLPKNTNLKIVQQAIARSEEDASILNVYFN